MLLLLSSCAGKKTDTADPADSTNDIPPVADATETAKSAATNYDKKYAFFNSTETFDTELSFDTVHEDFSEEKTKTLTENLSVKVSLPDYYYLHEYSSNGGCYSFNIKEAQCTGIVFRSVLEVPSDFVLSSEIDKLDHTYRKNYTIMGIPHDYTPEKIRTSENGFEYIVYSESHTYDPTPVFIAYVYIRISDNYIIAIDFCDTVEHRTNLDKIINSISFNGSVRKEKEPLPLTLTKTYDCCYENFSYSNELTLDPPVKISLYLPEFLEEAPADTLYDYTQENGEFMLKLHSLFKVDKDYVLSRTTTYDDYENHIAPFPFTNLNSHSYGDVRNAESIKTSAKGYDYIAYTSGSDIESVFSSVIYMRVSDEYILRLQINGTFENRPVYDDIINSIEFSQ